MKILITMIITLISLAGCSSVEKAFKTKSTEKENIDYTFEVDQAYYVAYQRILEQAKACAKPQFTARMVVKSELLNELKAADISVELEGFFSSNSYLKVRIDSSGENKSRIHVSNKWPKWNPLARAVKSWVVDNARDCEISAPEKAQS